MEHFIEYENGKPKIKNQIAFCSILAAKIPDDSQKISDLITHLDNAIQNVEPKVTINALNNCHGSWYEWLIAIYAWNYRIEYNKNFFILMLPNVQRFDVATFYNQSLSSYIKDLRKKVLESADVQLISSNPDFIVINPQDIQLNGFFSEKIVNLTPNSLRKLADAYTFFISKCGFDDIAGYLSVKTSLRPDRRLQISHEGSLMKALYVHLQTREWIVNPKGLKYYAAAIQVSDADKQALKTVATHSITNVQSVPQAAVDEIFMINSGAEAKLAFEKIMLE